jgi:hypothetical protein
MELAQARYARWLKGTTQIAVVLLVAAYAAYVFRLVKPHVPIEELPALWKLSSAEYLARTGVKPGWSWTAFIGSGDMLVLAAIALLISSSILCLAAVIPVFAKRRERMYVVMCVLQIAVLALAASGIFVR